MYKVNERSHLTRGAWIEIAHTSAALRRLNVSHLTRGAWIEIKRHHDMSFVVRMSHLTRGAWIEISYEFLNISMPSSRTSHEVRGLK